MLTNNKYVKRLQELRVLDLCNLDMGLKVPLIDENRLGAAKIEKFIIKGMFAAPKSYMLDYYADGKIKHVIKSKGVQNKFMTREIFMKMMEQSSNHFVRLDDGSSIIMDQSIMEQTFAELGIENPGSIPLPRMSEIVTEKWQRFVTGVTKTPIMKIIAPSHKKRLHDLETATSRPFRFIAEQLKHAEEVKQTLEHDKVIYKESIIESLDAIKRGESYGMVSMAMKKKLNMSNITRNGYTFEKTTLDEGRKRFMINLPKVRYSHLQDVVVRLAFSDPQFSIQAAYFIPKMISLIEKAIYVHKTNAHKKASEMQLSIDTLSKVYAYCLFVHHYLTITQIQINDNFDKICKQMSLVVRKYINDEQSSDSLSSGQEEAQRHRWRQAGDWGLHFLSSPVALMDYSKLPDKVKPQHYIDFVDIDHSVNVTTLWRVLSNFANHLTPAGIEKLVNADTDPEKVVFFDRLMSAELDQPLQFNFVSELRAGPGSERINELLAQKRDIEHSNEDDQHMDETGFNYLDAQMGQHPRGDLVYNERDINNLQERQDVTERKFVDSLFDMFMTHKNFVTIENEDMRRKMIELVFNQTKFPVSDDNLYKVFGMRFQNDIKVMKAHVVDYCLLFQFFYFGLTDALLIYNRIFVEWSHYTDDRNVFENQLMTLRIIFQKSTMFPHAKLKRTVPKKIGNLFQKLHRFALIDNMEQGMRSDECIRQQIMALATDYDCVTQQLKDMVVSCLCTNKDAINVGKGLTLKLLKWVHPTPAMENKLKAMLLMRSIPLHQDIQKQNLLIQQQIEHNDIKPIDIAKDEMFGIDFIDERFEWVTSNTHGWLAAVENQSDLQYQPSPDEFNLDLNALPNSPVEGERAAFLREGQRRFVRHAYRKESNNSGLELNPVYRTVKEVNAGGIRELYEEEKKHEKNMEFRFFDQYSQMSQQVDEEDQKLMDELARMDDLRNFRRERKAGFFFDFEAEEKDEESEDTLDHMFRRKQRK